MSQDKRPQNCGAIFKKLVDDGYLSTEDKNQNISKNKYLSTNNKPVNWGVFEDTNDFSDFKDIYKRGYYNLATMVENKQPKPFTLQEFCNSVKKVFDEKPLPNSSSINTVEGIPTIVPNTYTSSNGSNETVPNTNNQVVTTSSSDNNNNNNNNALSNTENNNNSNELDLQVPNNQVALLTDGPFSDITKMVIEMVLKKLESGSIGLLTDGIYKINIDLHLLKSVAMKLYISDINVTIDNLSNTPEDAVIILSNNPNEVDMLSVENLIDGKIKGIESLNQFTIKEDVKQLRKMYEDSSNVNSEKENITLGNDLHIQYNLFLGRDNVSINFDVIEYTEIKEPGMMGTPINKSIASNVISRSINITALQETIQTNNVLSDFNKIYGTSNRFQNNNNNNGISDSSRTDALRALEFTDEEINGNNINEDAIKNKVRTLLLKYHPDKGKQNNDKFNKINDAKYVLIPNGLTGGKRKRRTMKKGKTQGKRRKTMNRKNKKTMKRSKKQGKKRKTSKK
jgi:hypothetical protein